MAETTYNNLIAQALTDQIAAVDALSTAKGNIITSLNSKGFSIPASTKYADMPAKINAQTIPLTTDNGVITLANTATSVTLPVAYKPRGIVLTHKNANASGTVRSFCIFSIDGISGGHIGYSASSAGGAVATSVSITATLSGGSLVVRTTFKFVPGTGASETSNSSFAKGDLTWLTIK